MWCPNFTNSYFTARSRRWSGHVSMNQSWTRMKSGKISPGLSLILPCLVDHHHCHQHPQHSLEQHVRPSWLLFPTTFGRWLVPHQAPTCPVPGAPGKTQANTRSLHQMANGDESMDVILQTWFFGHFWGVRRSRPKIVVHGQECPFTVFSR